MAGLTLFIGASTATYYVESFNALLIVRMLTGLSAGTLSTCSLSYAGDHYPYEQRGRAMGVLSMAYFGAFVIGVPAGAFVAERLGWQSVFIGVAGIGAIVLVAVIALLPLDSHRTVSPFSMNSLASHFFHSDRLAGIFAALLTSGGIVGFLTYVGAWMIEEHGVSVDRVGLVFMAAGLAAVVAAPVSGWLSDRLGKRAVIVVSNLALALMFLIVAGLNWGLPVILGIGVLSIAASARQAPLHALTTELVDAHVRGEYIAIRNAASQFGIAIVAGVSAYAFDAGGFAAVAMLAAAVTILVPISCIWLKEPNAARTHG